MAIHSLGYMLMEVNPGRVLISFKITRLSPAVTKKSTRASPEHPSSR